MKKLKRLIKVLIIILIVVYLCIYMDVLSFFEKDTKILALEQEYKKEYYYNKLNDAQKYIYLTLAEGIESFDSDIVIKENKITKDLEVYENINIAFDALKKDNPEIFYISDKYETESVNFTVFSKTKIYVKYISDKEKITKMITELNQKVNKTIEENITAGMTDYDKELAIHDALSEYIEYFKYKKIEDIPDIKHNAYSALVKKSAVCDGFSKAFKIIMDKLKINCIFVVGITDKTPHAWNMVELDGEYYQVDLTSDQYEEEGTYHIYFNITDSEMAKTHTLTEKELLPTCKATKYNYYVKTDNIINKNDNFNMKLGDIVMRNRNERLLELKITSNKNKAQDLIKGLYNINFNNYQSKSVVSVSYIKVRDIYVIPKD